MQSGAGLIRVFVSLVAGIPCLAAPSQVSGTVYHRQGKVRSPLAQATVTVWAAVGTEVLGVVKTDARGRYQFVDLPADKIILRAGRPGYFTRKAGPAHDAEVSLDCSAEGACSHVDFELVKAGVVAGQVVDDLGDPLQDIEVALTRILSQERDTPGKSHSGSTDDRGIFRVAGLEPGEYILQAAEAFAGFPHDVSYATPETRLELEEGTDVEGLQIVMRRIARHRVSGAVQGVALSAGMAAAIEALPVPPADAVSTLRPARTVKLDEAGAFSFWNLPAGKYTLNLRIAREDSRETLRLPTLEVDRDLIGLVLEPVPPTGVAGFVKLEKGVAPQRVTLLFAAVGAQEARTVSAGPPDYRFEQSDFLPGAYQVLTHSEEYYVKRIGEGAESGPGGRVNLAPGEIRSLEIVIASDFGVVSGRLIHPEGPTGGKERWASNCRVALSGQGRVRTVPADQNGRFHFNNVLPGEYRIGAWWDLSEEAVRDEALWKRSADFVIAFPVEPNTEVEIDLRATP